ncbi:MAG TPA: hypothetical protein VGQ53_23100 [Chitinophagaceae bacterium]|nr:hypothetical protein [Chitinophagaceae bacterium]
MILRKFLIFFFFGALAAQCAGQKEDEQVPVIIQNPGINYLLKVVKNYFRSDPYQNEFGFFLKHLMNDPILINRTTRLKTDTSLFYFQGVYKNYSPFGFLADRTEVRLAETEFVIDDSTSTKDTLIVYQLIGVSNNGKAGLQSVKDEFSKFNRHYSKHFITQSWDVVNGDKNAGETTSYFVYGVATSPLTVSWAQLGEFESAFIITLRLKIK